MFSKRLKMLREEKGLTQKEVATVLGVAPSTYTLYEGGKREPGFSTLCKLSQYFNVSTDFLLGMSSVKNKDSLDSLNTKFHDLCDALAPYDKAERFVESLAYILNWFHDLDGEKNKLLSDTFFAIIDYIRFSIQHTKSLELRGKHIEDNILTNYTNIIKQLEYLRKLAALSVDSLWGNFIFESTKNSTAVAKKDEQDVIALIASVNYNNLDIAGHFKGIKSYEMDGTLKNGGDSHAEEENDAQCTGSGDDTPKE